MNGSALEGYRCEKYSRGPFKTITFPSRLVCFSFYEVRGYKNIPSNKEVKNDVPFEAAVIT